MPGWIVLSDCQAPAGAAPAALDRGIFVLEYRLPLDAPSVLLHLRGEGGGTLSVLHDPVAGPTIMFRQGSRLRRHMLHAPLPALLTGVARLSLRIDCQNRSWGMTFQALDDGFARETRGTDPLPFDAAGFARLADRMGGGHRHPAVLWFGLSPGETLPHAAPWIGLRTPIATDRGLVAAGLLRPGALIRTLDQGLLPLLGVKRMSLPSRGSFAPVVLRRPFFAAAHDLLVSADTRVLISGASVEYVTGEEEALIPAGALADGRVAQRDDRRDVTESLALDLGRPALIVADGCCLLAPWPGHAEAAPPRRALQDWEMPPLLALLGRTSLRHVA